VDVVSIRQKRELLDGICPEAVEILQDQRATGDALRELRKVRPMRQIKIAELMCAAGNFTVGYVKCLVVTTTTEQLVEGESGKKVRGLSPEDVGRMEREMESHAAEFKLIEESHGKNVLNLVLVVGYLRKLTNNAHVMRYLSQRYPGILLELQKLVESRALAEGGVGKVATE
jgi:hypothetical protein